MRFGCEAFLVDGPSHKTPIGLIWGLPPNTVVWRKDSTMLRITSTAFRHQEQIPTKHTCEGEDSSPALHWDSTPEATLMGTYRKKRA
jgi:hypothetical protein